MHIQSLTAGQSLASLHTSAAGLTAAEAKRRLAEFGLLLFIVYSPAGNWLFGTAPVGGTDAPCPDADARCGAHETGVMISDTDKNERGPR